MLISLTKQLSSGHSLVEHNKINKLRSKVAECPALYFPWYYSLFQGAPAIKQLKGATLKFVGFNPVKTQMIGPIISSSKESRKKWIKNISKLGLNAN